VSLFCITFVLLDASFIQYKYFVAQRTGTNLVRSIFLELHFFYFLGSTRSGRACSGICLNSGILKGNPGPMAYVLVSETGPIVYDTRI
jgi:hypothetical protein